VLLTVDLRVYVSNYSHDEFGEKEVHVPEFVTKVSSSSQALLVVAWLLQCILN
jgi:hypothetical protein